MSSKTSQSSGSPSKRLQEIPGIGPRMAEDLIDLGFSDVADLEGQDPEEMYRRLCELRGARIDPCVLYVFRSAVYFAEHTGKKHDPELLKWWRWKDRPYVRD